MNSRPTKLPKEVEWMKSMDHAALETPNVDVTAGVMRAVRSIRQDDERVFSVAAVLAVVVGVAAIAISLPLWFEAAAGGGGGTGDPLSGFADAINLVLQ